MCSCAQFFELGHSCGLATCQKAERNQVIKILKPVKKKKIKRLDVLLLFACDPHSLMRLPMMQLQPWLQQCHKCCMMLIQSTTLMCS